MDDLDFTKDLKIDKYNLDEEAVKHAELVAEWGMKWADAVLERDKLVSELDIIRGECDQEIRDNPGEFGWAKLEKAPSEAFIKGAISTHKTFIEANEKYLNAQYIVNLLSVARNAFDHRDRRINDLVKLFGSGYYSGNKKLGSAYDEALTTVVSEKQNEGLTKSSRLIRRNIE